jgi:putative peptidoglycan lipid II flippase
MAPRVLGLSFSQVNSFITLYLSGLITPESVPAYRLALSIMLMPQGVLGQAMGIAAFPTMSTLAAKSARDEMRRVLSDSLRLLSFLALPASVLLMSLGKPLIVLLFQRGAFGSSDADLVAWALLFYALGLIALAALEVIARAFYALGDTLTPVLAGGVQIGVMVALSPWLIRSVFPALNWHPLGGLALGFSLSNSIEVGILLWLLRRKMGGLNGRSLLDGLWRMGLASAAMLGVIWFALHGLAGSGALWQAVVGGLAGGVVYLLISWLLRVAEVEQFWGYGRRLLKRA